MYPVSSRFLAAVSESHQPVTVVDVYAQGDIVRSGINVQSGSITRDRRAQQYARVALVVAEPELIPTTPTSELGPAGFEIGVSRGVRFADGTTELIPLGIFPIQEANVTDDLATDITAIDRSQRVSDAKLETDRSYEAVLMGPELVTVCAEVIPDLVSDISAATGDESSPLLVFSAESDRWTDIVLSVCKARGWEAFFDGLGHLILRDEPSLLGSDPIAVIGEGENGVLLEVDLSWERAPSFNRAIVTGSNTTTGATFRGVATDNDPSSPSYYFGQFGPKPYFVNSPLITSNANAGKAAKALLTAKQGVAKSLNFGLVPNPAIEPGDVVTVRRARLGLDEAVIIDSITLGLGPEDPMTCEVRARQEMEIEV